MPEGTRARPGRWHERPGTPRISEVSDPGACRPAAGRQATFPLARPDARLGRGSASFCPEQELDAPEEEVRLLRGQAG